MRECLICLSLLYCSVAAAQEYNYIHYDTKDGLASSTVYRMCQDKKGYMWFATDNGVSRFDGKRFTNFTTEDGLTDNEVLFIAPDSKGRIWMMPFNKTVCYYYEGKIYNASNDSLLKKIQFSSNGIMAGENKKGEIYFITSDGIFLLSNSGEMKLIGDFKEMGTKYSMHATDFIPANITDQYPYGMVLYNQHAVFINQGDSFTYLKNIQSNPTKQRNFYRVSEDLEVQYPKSGGMLNFNSGNPISRSSGFFNTIHGSWAIDKEGNINPRPFLTGKKTSHAFLDSEGNTWFATIGEGIYRVSSVSMGTFSNNQETFCIEKANGKIYAGASDGTLEVINNLQLEKNYPFPDFMIESSSKRLYTLKSDSSGALYMGFDSHLAKLDKKQQIFSTIRPIKSIDIADENTIIVCTNFLALKLRGTDLKIVDTIWRERGTKVIYSKGYYYIGTLNGLVIIDPDKKVTRAAVGIPLLGNRIVDMVKSADGGIWIATNDNGVILYNKNRVEAVINNKSGLSSNICRSLFLNGNYLWVGTNKGVNKIDAPAKKVLAKYSTSDGLGSDIINAVYCEGDIIWVGSPVGLTYFREKNISDSSICILDMYAINVSGQKKEAQANLQLTYKNNNISFDYSAISFKSAGDIIYRYRLKGLDENWNETKLTTLGYPSLPSGDYEFQLYAVNKFGRKSEMFTIHFAVAAPFWKTVWFWLTAFSIVLAGFWYFLNRKYKQQQKKLKEKNDIARRITELEHASLRAQMNPHFIFNCLNSIQYFVLKNDLELTNRYISQFGSLIRQTLDNSAKMNITIAEEINYLGCYLELEKIRFSPAFEYVIQLAPEIQADYTFIPSMLLQPFVENAIRHGIRYKKDGAGFIRVAISQFQDGIEFSIEDNGIGREAARVHKNAQHIEYQSKGITLTQNRLDILNLFTDKKITVRIDDLKDMSGNATGTKGFIFFPHNIIDKFRQQ